MIEFFMVLKNNPLSGEERKIISTRLYRSEFLHFKKICEQSGKSVNTKLRMMVKEEIEKNPELSKNILIKIKEGKERSEEEIRSRQKELNFEIKRNKENV